MAKARTWAPKQFFGGWGWGEFAKKMGLYFLQIQSRSKPCTDDVLRYLNIKGPSKHPRI